MRDVFRMRTTLNLDDDVLETAKAMAARQRKPLGEVISGLIRRAVETPAAAVKERNGMPLFPVSRSARPVTPDAVKELLDEVP
jgi:hypothetical protein